MFPRKYVNGGGGGATEWKPSNTDGCLVYITVKVWSRYRAQGFTYTSNFPTTAKAFKCVQLKIRRGENTVPEVVFSLFRTKSRPHAYAIRLSLLNLRNGG